MSQTGQPGTAASLLANVQLAFAGAAAAPPVLTTQSGRLDGQLGSTVLALGGVAGPLVSNLRAASVLVIAQTAVPAPTFAAHASPRWVLGGQDSKLGATELAFAGAAAPQPATGTRTGKLGTPTSLLGGMRLALGQQEGGGGGTITYATATSTLAASSNAAVAGIVRSPAATSALALTGAAGVGCARGESATSTLALTEAAAVGAVRQVAAAHALDLTDAVTTAAVFVAAAASAASLTAAADVSAALTLAAADTLALMDGAARTASISLAASSAIGPATAADASAVRAVAAESTLVLMVEAATGTVSAASMLSLGSAAGLCTILNVGPVSSLDLGNVAAETTLRTLAATSAISPATAASATVGRLLTAGSLLTLAAVAAAQKSATNAATSPMSLGSAASVSVVRGVSAASTLALAQTADRNAIFAAASALDDLWDEADVAVVRSLSVQSAVALIQTEETARPWYLDAQTPIQIAGYQYNALTYTYDPTYEGLQDAASVYRPLAAAVQQPIPLVQSAFVVQVKPTAISLSAESVLELLGEVHPSPTGDSGNWLVFSQTATVDQCKTTQSALALIGQAAAAHSGPRGATSALSLGQAISYSIVLSGIRQQYHPFVGEGVEGAPTPPSVTVEPPPPSELPFQLFYPATGTVTDSVTLRAPNLGNKDRLSFNRIVRETRGGTLIVFADPIWPKLETLVLSFSGLSATQSQQLLAFLETHLGEEIGLLDWEGRCWQGVIMTPTNPVVQDTRDCYSVSLEFEGELAAV